MKANPVHDWLARVASECMSPAGMLGAASIIKNDNTRRLIVEYAKLWQKKLNDRKPA